MFAVFSLAGLRAQPVPGLAAIRVTAGLNQPIFVTAPPGDNARLFIVQQDGYIRILNLATSTLKEPPFLRVTGLRIAAEQGLLGMAFDPNYAANGKFYLHFTVPGGAFNNGVSHISQFAVSANPDIANPNSEKILLTFDHPQANHNGGWIGFSPRSGDVRNLYIGTGDGGGSNDQGTGHIEPGGNAQSKATLLGKMLRIHVNPNGTYTIPANNPFVGVSGARPEIWAFGLRNPFQNSFDRQTGDMFISDVGESAREEIDVQKATRPRGGENYGWRLREGLIATPGAVGGPQPPGGVNPIFDYPRTIGRTVIGGYVYRGQQIPALRGTYVFGDFLGPEGGPDIGRIFSLNYNGTSASNFQNITSRLFPTEVGGFTLSNPSSFGEDASGELYIVDIGTGTLFKIVPSVVERAPAKGDFNRDENADLLWQNNTTGERALWLMDGTTYSRSVFLEPVSTQWNMAGASDFNGDRDADILWQNSATGARAIWLMNGTAYRSSVSLGTIATAWNITGASDFDGDEKPDILWQNSATGARAIWLMNGTAFRSSVSLGAVPTAWNIVGSSDFNGDKKADILWQNNATGARAIWLMNRTAFSSAVSLGTVPIEWNIAGASDFSGDGRADILWQNSATGARAIWLMNRTTFSSSVFLPAASTQWSIKNF